METSVNDYKKASFFMVGFGMLFQLIGHFILINTEYRTPVHDWTASVCSLTIPLFCFWIGGLLRTVFPKPKAWVRAVLCIMIPLMYVRLLIWPETSIFYRMQPGYYPMMLSLVILGFLLLPVCESLKEKGWLWLVLFLASAFCFVGIVRVSDHFSLVNFTLRDSEWTTLFIRMIKYVPLVMSLFFLTAFSLSEAGQRIGGMKWLKWTAVVLVLVSGLYLYSPASWWYVRMRTLPFHPFTVYLAMVVVRIIRKVRFKENWKDVFMI